MPTKLRTDVIQYINNLPEATIASTDQNRDELIESVMKNIFRENPDPNQKFDKNKVDSAIYRVSNRASLPDILPLIFQGALITLATDFAMGAMPQEDTIPIVDSSDQLGPPLCSLL